MAILTKQQLLDDRAANIFPNMLNLVSASMVGSHLDSFINSIWAYADSKLGELTVFNDFSIGVPMESYIDFQDNIIDFSTGTNAQIRVNGVDKIRLEDDGILFNQAIKIWDDSKMGIEDENYINYDANEMSINVNSEYMKINMLHSTDKNIEIATNNIYLVDNTEIFGINKLLIIGTKQLKTNTDGAYIEFAGDDISIRTNFDNGVFQVVDSGVSPVDVLFSVNASRINLNDGMSIRIGLDDGITDTFTYVNANDEKRQFIIKGGIIVGEEAAV